MIDQSKSKIIGAFVVGAAFVGGAYVISNFGDSRHSAPNSQSATAIEMSTRNTIAVTDENQDGIEDWREDFIKSSTVQMSNGVDENYTLPDTLTGQAGISLFQNSVRSEMYEGLGRSQEQVVEDTVDQITQYATDTIYDINDIIVSSDRSAENVRRYANSHANAIINNSVPGLENELLILRDVLNNQDEEGIEELKMLSLVYLNTRNEVLALNVPPQLVKAHLDLINVYSALHFDIEAMTKANEDPLLSLVRLRRYEEDAEGLAMALENMYEALEPYGELFEANDAATLFAIFSSNFQ